MNLLFVQTETQFIYDIISGGQIFQQKDQKGYFKLRFDMNMYPKTFKQR